MIDERELAQQMSQVASHFYCKILPREWLGWNRKDKDTVCINIWFVFYFCSLRREREREERGRRGKRKTVFIKKIFIAKWYNNSIWCLDGSEHVL